MDNDDNKYPGKTFFIATIQPEMRDKENHVQLLDDKEKRNFVRNIRSSEEKIPLCVEHADGDGHGFVVPYDRRIGFVEDVFVDKRNNLVIEGEMFQSEEGKRILQDYLHDGKKYGVSAWTDLKMYPGKGKDGSDLIEKKITHIGITRNPALGEENSYIHEFSNSKEAIHKKIRESYFDMNDDKVSFANESSKKKWGIIDDKKNKLIEGIFLLV
jgi:hypothetical protein